MYDSYWPPEADLMNMVVHLQLEVEVLKFVQSGPSTSATKSLPVQSKPEACLHPPKCLSSVGVTS